MRLISISMAFLAILFSLESSSNAAETEQMNLDKLIKQSHPRIILTEQREEGLTSLLSQTSQLNDVYSAIKATSDEYLTLPQFKNEKIGRRLLDKSRKTLKRVTYLALVYHNTGDKRYLKAAEEAMLNAAGFDSWNTSHFLDVGEMTAALGLGLDWLYNDLSEQSRDIIATAIIEKGLEPSFAGRMWWTESDINWNQVCNGALAIGALAVYEKSPALATKIIKRAVSDVPRAMAVYEPDGAYPEGPGYWIYGTSYNVLLVDALKTALNTDFGLSEFNGFSKCGEYHYQTVGLSGLAFNYSDCSAKIGWSPAIFWLAQNYDKPYWASSEIEKLADTVMPSPRSDALSEYGRFNVMALLWAKDLKGQKDNQASLSWMAKCENDIAILRNKGLYVGVKGGTVSASHSHMDIGSFIIDTEGIRWAEDLGGQNYNRVEQMGIKLFQASENGDRWRLFRYTNLAHNTLVVDGTLQNIKGVANIVDFSSEPKNPYAKLDLSQIYPTLASAGRTVSITPQNEVVIEDKLQAGEKDCEVRWAFATGADIEIDGNIAILSIAGEKMRIVASASNQEVLPLQIYPAQGVEKFDEPAEGKKMLGFATKLAASEQSEFKVVFTKLNIAQDK